MLDFRMPFSIIVIIRRIVSFQRIYMISLLALVPYGKMIGFSIIGLLGVGFIITFHELGHFLFCKLFNIKTPTFSIGFGPTLFQKKVKDTSFVVAAIPVGGYVEIANTPGEDAPLDRTFSGKPFYQKFLVILGGILFNLMFAYVAVIALYWTGMPETSLAYPLNATATINAVIPDSPASAQSFQENDQIVNYQDDQQTIPFDTAENFLQFVRTHPGKSITLQIIRNDTATAIPVTIGNRPNDPSAGYLGIIFKTRPLPPMALPHAITRGIATTNKLIFQIAQGFWQLLQGKSKEQLGGPIMLISQTVKMAERGVAIFIALLALISINLAIINLFPLPILDGGQLLIVSLEALFGRQIPVKIKEYIFIGCWILALILILYISFKDIRFLRMGK